MEKFPDPGIQHAGVVNDRHLAVNHLGSGDVEELARAGDVLLVDLLLHCESFGSAGRVVRRDLKSLSVTLI